MELLLILLDGLEFLGTPVWDSEDFLKLLIKVTFNLGIVLLIVRYIYYPVTKNKDYLFTYFHLSLILAESFFSEVFFHLLSNDKNIYRWDRLKQSNLFRDFLTLLSR